MSSMVCKRRFEISVVVPAHNRAHTLGRALDSVVAQTSAAKEVIVADDGSTDGTFDLLSRRYPQVNVISQKNRGASAARNAGIEASSGEWIALLDSDDEWLPRKLESQIRVLSEQHEMRFCHSDEIWMRNGRRVNAMDKHKKCGGWIYQHCLPLCAVSPSAALIHRSVFDECGLFDESLPACEDYDMWLRVCSHMPVAYVGKNLIVKYGGHADQLSKRYWGMDRFRVTALQNILRTGSLTDEDRAATINMLVRKLNILISGAKKRSNTELVERYREILAEYEPVAFDDMQMEGVAA